MFGTLTIYKEQLNTEDRARYQTCYCGLCRTLRQKFGIKSQLILTYDCTFLAILLHSVYESEEISRDAMCFHKASRVHTVESDALSYAADMNLLLSYQNYQDKVFDGKTASLKRMAKAAVRTLKHDYEELRRTYPRQAKALETYMTSLHAYEQAPDENVEYAANLTGEMLREIFVEQEDEFSSYLRKIGFFLGKYIYLSDAYEDLEEDLKSGNYNPFASMADREDLSDTVKELMESVMAECTRYFEMLPVFIDREILRNILYSGSWIPYAHARKKRETAESGKEKDGKE